MFNYRDTYPEHCSGEIQGYTKRVRDVSERIFPIVFSRCAI